MADRHSNDYHQPCDRTRLLVAQKDYEKATNSRTEPETPKKGYGR
jgi:hypothetical protein